MDTTLFRGQVSEQEQIAQGLLDLMSFMRDHVKRGELHAFATHLQSGVTVVEEVANPDYVDAETTPDEPPTVPQERTLDATVPEDAATIVPGTRYTLAELIDYTTTLSNLVAGLEQEGSIIHKSYRFSKPRTLR